MRDAASKGFRIGTFETKGSSGSVVARGVQTGPGIQGRPLMDPVVVSRDVSRKYKKVDLPWSMGTSVLFCPLLGTSTHSRLRRTVNNISTLATSPHPPPDQNSRQLTMKFTLVLLALISVVVAAPAPQDTIPDAGTAETTDGPDSLSFGFGGSQSERGCRTIASSQALGGR